MRLYSPMQLLLLRNVRPRSSVQPKPRYNDIYVSYSDTHNSTTLAAVNRNWDGFPFFPFFFRRDHRDKRLFFFVRLIFLRLQLLACPPAVYTRTSPFHPEKESSRLPATRTQTHCDEVSRNGETTSALQASLVGETTYALPLLNGRSERHIHVYAPPRVCPALAFFREKRFPFSGRVSRAAAFSAGGKQTREGVTLGIVTPLRTGRWSERRLRTCGGTGLSLSIRSSPVCAFVYTFAVSNEDVSSPVFISFVTVR